MKLETLFEGNKSLGALHHRPFAEKLLTKFRQLADKYQLIMGSALSWPQVSSKRVMFAASLADRVRYGPNSKEPVDERIPLEIRAKGFLNALGKELESLVEAGHEVFVYHNGDRKHGTRVTANNAAAALKDNLSNGQFSPDVAEGPTVLWSVSTPKVDGVLNRTYTFEFELWTQKKGTSKFSGETAIALRKFHTFVPDDNEEFRQKYKQLGFAYVSELGDQDFQKLLSTLKKIADSTGKKLEVADDPTLHHIRLRPTSAEHFSKRTSTELPPEKFMKDVIDPILTLRPIFVKESHEA